MNEKEYIDNIIREVASQTGTAIDSNDPVVVAALIIKRCLDDSLNELNVNKLDVLADNINSAMIQYTEKADIFFERIDGEKELNGSKNANDNEPIPWTGIGIGCVLLMQLLIFFFN